MLQVIDIVDDRIDGILPVIGKSVFTAIITGSMVGITSMVLNLTWHDYYDNQSLMQIMSIQWIANIFFVIILTAVIAIMLSCTWIKSLRTSIVPGCISGFVLVFTSAFFLEAATLVQMSPIFAPGDGYTMFDYFAENPIGYFGKYFANVGYILIACSFIAAIFAGIVGLTYWSYFVKPKGGHSGKTRNVSVKRVSAIIIAMIIILVVPPAVGITGLHMGWIEKSWNEYNEEYMNSVIISRASEDTIYVNYTASSDLQLDSHMPYMININGKNATNMEAIRQSGLNASISPAEGLKNVKGASVELTGSDILPGVHQDSYYNTYNGTHVVIVYVRYDGEKGVIYDTVV